MATSDEIRVHLERLKDEPDDLAAIEALGLIFPPERDVDPAEPDSYAVSVDALTGLEEALRHARSRGDIEHATVALEVYAALISNPEERVQHYRQLVPLYQDELMEERAAEFSLRRLLALQPDDAEAASELQMLEDTRKNWKKLVKKLVAEAEASRSKDLATQFFERAAATIHANAPGSPEVEEYLRKALEVDPRNRKAAGFLRRLFAKAGRWEDLAAHLEALATQARSRDERIRLLLELGSTLRTRVGNEEGAIDAHQKVLALDPANQDAMSHLTTVYSKKEDWPALIQLYENALRARPRGDAELAVLLQIALLWWRKMTEPDRAEEYFKRIRKIDPTHSAMLDFAREYYAQKGEFRELLTVLASAQRAAKEEGDRINIGREIAEVAAGPAENPERAIDAWKGILRIRPGMEEGRDHLRQLYQQTGKWNALLELLKEEIASHGEAETDAKVSLYEQMVAIYRDELHLDVMVINTYNNILAIDPGNEDALGALAERYESMGRFNDLINVLARQVESARESAERVPLLRRIAGIWIERFNNHNQAIKPLEKLLELKPDDDDARDQLRDIYRKRRDWMGLVKLMRREAEAATTDAGRINILAEAAEIALTRMDRPREAIQLWNNILEVDEREPRALQALADLYKRERRWPALAEIDLRLADVAPDNDERIRQLRNLAEVYAQHMQVPEQAMQTWRDILAINPDDGPSRHALQEALMARGDWAALDAMFAEAGAWDEYALALRSAAERTPDPAQKVSLFTRLAALQEDRLDDPATAATTRERILAVDPENRQAAEALVPYYTQSEVWGKLASAYEVLLNTEQDQPTQRAFISEIRRICEERLGDPGRAFLWQARAFKMAPHSRDALAELHRLAQASDSWEELELVLQEALAGLPEGDARSEILRTIASIELRQLGRLGDAREHYEEILANRPEDQEALGALDQIYAQSGDHDRLMAVLQQRIGLTSDARERRQLLRRMAEVQEDVLEQPEAAAATYRALLEELGDDGASLKALQRIYRQLGRAQEHYEVAQRRVPLLSDEERGAHFTTLGELAASLGDGEAALSYLDEALRSDPNDDMAVRGLAALLENDAFGGRAALILAPVYEQRGAWTELASAREVILIHSEDLGLDAAGQSEQYTSLGVAYEDQIGDPEKALQAFRSAYLLNPDHPEADASLRRLSGALGRVDELAFTYEEALKAADEPGRKAALAASLGTLYVEQLDKPDDAIRAYETVMELEPEHPAASAALERLYTAQEKWTALLRLRRGLAERALDPNSKVDLLRRNAQLYDDIIGNPDAAAESYQELFELAPEDAQIGSALERLLRKGERWDELAALLARRAGTAESDAERSELNLKLGLVQEQYLQNAAEAADAYLTALSDTPGLAEAIAALERLMHVESQRGRIAEALEPIYLEQGNHTQYVATLEAQLALAEDPDRRRELAGRVGELKEELLGDLGGALDAWRAALVEDPLWEQPREELIRLADRTDRWDDVVTALRGVLEGDADLDETLRGELSLTVARGYETRLGNVAEAAVFYRQLLQVEPESDDALDALERVYVATEDWANLVDILARKAEILIDPSERRAVYMRIGQIHEELTDDKSAATKAYEAIAHDDPGDHMALRALEHLYREAESWSDLARTLQRRIDAGPGEQGEDPDAYRSGLLWEIGAVQEERLQDLEAAADAYAQILDEQPLHAEAYRALHRLYGRLQRWDSLLSLLEQAEGVAEDDERRADLLCEQGELLRTHLEDRSRSVSAFARSTEFHAGHEGARTALLELAREEETGLAATEVLVELLRSLGQAEPLADVLELRARWSVDEPVGRAELLREAAQVAEEAIGDSSRAFDDLCGAMRSDPGQAGLVEDLERLSAATTNGAKLAALYKDVVAEIVDPDLQLRVYLRVGELGRLELGDNELAVNSYRQALELDGDSTEALAALELIYTETSNWQELCSVLRQRADYALDDQERAGYLRQVANVLEAHLEDPEGAIDALGSVLDTVGEDAQALDGLARLYTGQARWTDLRDVLTRRLEASMDPDERVSLHSRLAELLQRHLSAPGEAIEHWTAALEAAEPGSEAHTGALSALEGFLAPDNDQDLRLLAIEVLEPVAQAAGNAQKLVDISEIRLDVTYDQAERVELLERIYGLQDEQLGNRAAAFAALGRLLKEDPTDRTYRGRLLRLAALLDGFDDLAAMLGQIIEDGIDEPAASEIAHTLGYVHQRFLENPEAAAGYYRRVLDDPTFGPDAEEAVGRLHLEGERWDELLEFYRDRADATLDQERRMDLLRKIAALQEEVKSEPEKAIEAWNEIREIDDGSTDARAALERLLNAVGRWDDLAAHFQRELELLTEEDERDGVRLRLANVLVNHLGDSGSAVDLLEDVVRRDVANEDALKAMERLLEDADQRLRVAEILQPIYEETGEWRKVVSSIEIRLTFTDDPSEQLSMLLRVAELLEVNDGPPEETFAAYARAFKVRYGDEEIRQALERLAESRGAWEALAGVFEDGLEDVLDPTLQVEMLLRLAALAEERLGRPDAAIERYRQVLDADESNIRALDALERLYTGAGDDAKLVEILERKAQAVFEEDVRAELLYRAGALWERLEQPDRAIAAYRQVLEIRAEMAEAADALERLLRAGESWEEVVDHLRSRVVQSTDTDQRRTLRRKAAEVLEGQLGDLGSAISEWQAIRDDEPGIPVALEALERLFRAESAWTDVLGILRERAEVAEDGEGRNRARLSMAQVHSEHLDDPLSAIQLYQEVLSEDGRNEPALMALERIAQRPDYRRQASEVLIPHLESAARWDALAKVLDLGLEVAPDAEEKLLLLERLGEVREAMLGDQAAAFDAYLQAVAIEPHVRDWELMARAERLAQVLGQFRRLTDELARGVAIITDPDVEALARTRLARLYEDETGERDKAIDQLRVVLDQASDASPTLEALDRLLLATERWSELGEILEKRIEHAMDAGLGAELRMRLAVLCIERFGESERGVLLYREVLESVPAHPGALEALEALAEQMTLRAMVAEILEPVYRATDNAERLAWLRELQVEMTDEPGEKVRLLSELAQIREAQLQNPASAFVALLRAFRTDPEADDVVTELERLAANMSVFDDLVAAAEEILERSDLPQSSMRDLHLQAAGWYLHALSDAEGAERNYLKALELEPESTDAMDALIDVYGQAPARTGDLVTMLGRRAALEFDMEAQKGLLFRGVELAEQNLGDTAKAAELAREVRRLDEGDRRALETLVRLGEAAERWEEVADCLNRLAELADDPADRVELRLRLGNVRWKRLHDLDEAARSFRGILDIDAGNVDAFDALEELFTGAERWMDLQETLSTRLHAASSTGDTASQVAARLRLAALMEERFDDRDAAVDHLREAIAVDSTSDVAWDALGRILESLGRWEQLVELLQERAAEADEAGRLRLYMRAGEVRENKLEDLDAALESYQTVLQQRPDEATALSAVGRICLKQERWSEASVALERAAEVAGEDDQAAEMFCNLAKLRLEHLDDQSGAEAAYVAALDRSRYHDKALAELGRLYESRDEWEGLATLKTIALEQVNDDQEKVSGFKEIATLYWEKLNDGARSADALEQAARVAPADTDLHLLLAERYIDAKRWDDAESRFQELLRVAQAKRKRKDAAAYLHKLARIAAGRADPDSALDLFNQAYKSDPTNAAIAADLGQLLFSRQAWQEALKIYRALLLHKLPPECGVKKSDVYYMLGMVRLQLDEKSKALNMFERGLEGDKDHREMRKQHDALKAAGVK